MLQLSFCKGKGIGTAKVIKPEPIIRYENTVPGFFIRRVNRFVAEVRIDGKPEKVHVKNTGRLKELLVPEAKITLQRVKNPDRKTPNSMEKRSLWEKYV